MKHLLSIFFLFLPALVWGQSPKLALAWAHREKLEENNSGIKYGSDILYSSQIHSTLEIGRSKYLKLSIGDTGEDGFGGHHHIINYWSAGASLEFVLAKQFIFAPKIFSTFCYKFISTQINIAAYTDFKKIDPVITPEIGIGKWLSIRYGYNFHLTKNSFYQVGNHRFVIAINWYFPHFIHTM